MSDPGNATGGVLGARLLGPVWRWQWGGTGWEVVPVEVALRALLFAAVAVAWLSVLVGRPGWTMVGLMLVAPQAMTATHELGHLWAARWKGQKPLLVRFYRQAVVDWGDEPISAQAMWWIALAGPVAAVTAGVVAYGALRLVFPTMEGFAAAVLVGLWGVLASGLAQLVPCKGTDGSVMRGVRHARRQGWDLVVWDDRNRPHPAP